MLVFDESPPANLEPVEFDFGAASTAEQALTSCAEIIDRAARLRASDARNAVVGWTGDQYTAFEADENALSRRASGVVTQLRADAAKLRAAADAARAENARRARGLAVWNHDLAAARLRWDQAQARSLRPVGR
jgi:hypothetical protein